MIYQIEATLIHVVKQLIYNAIVIVIEIGTTAEQPGTKTDGSLGYAARPRGHHQPGHRHVASSLTQCPPSALRQLRRGRREGGEVAADDAL